MAPGFRDPVCPFLCLEVIEQKFLGVSGESSVGAGHPATSEENTNCPSPGIVEICFELRSKISMSILFVASGAERAPPKADSFPVGRPGWIRQSSFCASRVPAVFRPAPISERFSKADRIEDRHRRSGSPSGDQRGKKAATG